MTKDEKVQQLRREIERWSRRPPSRSPQMARRAVLTRLDERSPGRRWGLGWAAAAAVVVAALGLGILTSRSQLRLDQPVRTASLDPMPRAAEGMVVYQLESGATLYVPLAGAAPRLQGTGADKSVKGERR
ncbi:MAG: hypothetical protein OEM62_08210 [Acidobacteriota bacterium]|nr:hypothetical protein [Acidobacteriota bacterium]